MKFYFYANASRVSGSGHVMRMYALAEEAKARNVTTVLIGHIDGIPWLTQQKLKEVFDYILNDPNLLNSEITNSVLFWDAYHDPNCSSGILKLPFAKKILIADAATPVQHADTVILLEPSEAWQTFVLQESITCLSGRSYLPIRKSHRVTENFSEISTNATLKILILAGGVDFNSFVVPLATYIAKEFTKVEITAITSHIPNVKMDNLYFVAPTDRIDSMFDSADLVLTSAGTTIFEVLSRRIPSGFVVTVANQYSNREFLNSEKLSIEIGQYADGSFQIHQDNLSKLINDYEFRKELQKTSLRKFSGSGAKLILDYTLKSIDF